MYLDDILVVNKTLYIYMIVEKKLATYTIHDTLSVYSIYFFLSYNLHWSDFTKRQVLGQYLDCIVS